MKFSYPTHSRADGNQIGGDVNEPDVDVIDG
jgi:hypothetical protein